MSDRDSERRKRQSEALRENLKRRKSQLRGRAASPAPPPETDKAIDPPDDDR